LLVLFAFAGGVVTGLKIEPLEARAEESAPRNYCRVVDVIDGQSLLIEWRGMTVGVRLRNTQAPAPGSPGYRSARRALEEIVAGQDVWLELERVGLPERGERGNLKAHVYVGDGKVVANVEMVRRGWSKYWPDANSNRLANAFIRAEHEARRARVGLWQAATPGVRLP
jgi:endonuclease YncB( thermonuclease family)